MDLVHFELNNWFPGEDYPDVEPFKSWVEDLVLDNDEWAKENKLVILSGFIDMSKNWCITATKEWVLEHCPELLENTPFTYAMLRTGRDGTQKIEKSGEMSKFLREPDADGDVYGRFSWRFPDYCEENFGVQEIDDSEEMGW